MTGLNWIKPVKNHGYLRTGSSVSPNHCTRHRGRKKAVAWVSVDDKPQGTCLQWESIGTHTFSRCGYREPVFNNTLKYTVAFLPEQATGSEGWQFVSRFSPLQQCTQSRGSAVERISPSFLLNGPISASRLAAFLQLGTKLQFL